MSDRAGPPPTVRGTKETQTMTYGYQRTDLTHAIDPRAIGADPVRNWLDDNKPDLVLSVAGPCVCGKGDRGYVALLDIRQAGIIIGELIDAAEVAGKSAALTGAVDQHRATAHERSLHGPETGHVYLTEDDS